MNYTNRLLLYVCAAALTFDYVLGEQPKLKNNSTDIRLEKSYQVQQRVKQIFTKSSNVPSDKTSVPVDLEQYKLEFLGPTAEMVAKDSSLIESNLMPLSIDSVASTTSVTSSLPLTSPVYPIQSIESFQGTTKEASSEAEDVANQPSLEDDDNQLFGAPVEEEKCTDEELEGRLYK